MPIRVFSTRRPGSSPTTHPDAPRALAPGLRSDGGERRVHAVAGHDRQEAALAGHVERVEAEQLARPLHLRAHRDLGFLEPDPHTRGDGDLATARWRAPRGWGRGGRGRPAPRPAATGPGL